MDQALLDNLLVAVNLNLIGMGIVFVLLEVIADAMRLITRLFPERPEQEDEDVLPTPKSFKAAAKAATQVASQMVVKPLTAASEVATQVARPISAAQRLIPYQFVAAAALHHYRRTRRGFKLNLHQTAETRWRR